MTSMPTAILAGGLGTRLKPFTDDMPKALVPVLGEPFVFHQLRLLRARGITEIVMLVGYLGEQIVEVVGDGGRFDMKVEYLFDGKELLGTGGAIIKARSVLGPAFFVLYGDSYLDCDYDAAQTTFESSGKSGLMTVFRNTNKWDKSNVEFHGGRIIAYSKTDRTAAMHYIDYGLGCFHESAFDGVTTDQPEDLAAIYQRLLGDDNLAALEVRERFYEVGSISGIRDLEAHLASTRV